MYALVKAKCRVDEKFFIIETSHISPIPAPSEKAYFPFKKESLINDFYDDIC